MKPVLTAIVLFTSLLGASAALAHDAGLDDCAHISNALDRLDCYDALAEHHESTNAPALPVATEPASEPVMRPPPAKAPSLATVAENDGGYAQHDRKDFGFESKRIETTPDSMTSRYIGQFTGWSGKTLFRLENGQVWKQAQTGRVSYRRDSPITTIKKGAFGSFRLSVDGLNKTVRVKRIK